MEFMEILLVLIKALGWEEEVKQVLVNLMPVESAFDAMMNVGINLSGIFFTSIGFFATIIVIAFLAMCLMMILTPPDSISLIKPYGGIFGSGLTSVMPGLGKYIIGPQTKIAMWMINIFMKPMIFILLVQISLQITGCLLCDRAFISDMLTSLFASPFLAMEFITTAMSWMVFILATCSFVWVAGLFAYPIIEAGNAFGDRISEWIEEMMYASLIIPPLVAILYRVAFIMNAQNNPIIGMVMWFAAIAIPFVIVAKGLVKMLAKIVIDIVVMYVFKGIAGKGFLSGAQSKKLLATFGVLNRASGSGNKDEDQSPHRTGLPTEVCRTAK